MVHKYWYNTYHSYFQNTSQKTEETASGNSGDTSHTSFLPYTILSKKLAFDWSLG